MSNHTSVSNLADRLNTLDINTMASRASPAPRPQASSSSGSTSTATLHGGHQGSFKVAQPDLYYGDRKKLREFLSQVQLNFMFHPQSVDTPAKKIIYAATYLRGAAHDWFEPYMKDQLENGDQVRPETIQIFQSFENFKVKINQVYGDTDTKKEAEQELLRLRQKSSASKYASDFHQLSSRVTWHDSAFAAVFYTGLKDSVKDELARIDRPEELQPLIELAIKIDNRNYERQMEKGQGRTATFIPRYQKNVGKPRRTPGHYPPGGSMPMDLSTTQHKRGKFKPRKGGLSPAQRKERMDKKLCMYCGKPGHYAKECPNKQQLHATEGAPEERLPSQNSSKVSDQPWKLTEEDKIAPTTSKGWTIKELNTKPDGTWDAREAVLSEPSDLDIGEPAQKLTAETKHSSLSWTGCYDDSCTTHMSDKEATGWYPRKPRQNNPRDKGQQSLCVTTIVPPKRVPTKIVFDDKYVEMTTRFWRRQECHDPECDIESQHQHKFFTPEETPQLTKAKLRLLICRDDQCPDKNWASIHCHQGRSERGETDEQLVEAQHAVYTPQSLSMTQMDLREEEGWLILEKKPTPKITKEGLRLIDTARYRDPWKPYGHFQCSDEGCPHEKTHESHSHFRNWTKNEMWKESIAINPTPHDESTGCHKPECEVLGIYGPHIHTGDPKNV